MREVFRIGLLGASRIARSAILAPARDDPRFIVTAVAARDPGRAHAYAQEHGIGAVAADYAELVERDDVDVVYNALPAAGHARWSIAALAAGKAVLCEKPFARTADEARAMVHAAHAARRPLLEAFHYRFHRVMRRAQALALGGELGALHSGAAEFHVPVAKTHGELRWIADQGGGALMDLGCYPLHALRTLTGAEPEVASVHMTFDDEAKDGAKDGAEDGVDVATRAELVFPGGVSAHIACSMSPDRPSAWLRLEGALGRIDIVNFVAPQLGCRFTATVGGEIRQEATEGPSTYAAQLEHLHAVLTGQTAPLTGGADAIGQMAAIEAIQAKGRAAMATKTSGGAPA